jgi:hypothetical protein
MSPLDAKKTLQNMLRKGFVETINKGKDHKRIEFWHNGKLTRARTKLSHNDQELNDYLIGMISKQICLSRAQFVKFAICHMSESDYIEALRSHNYID